MNALEISQKNQVETYISKLQDERDTLRLYIERIDAERDSLNDDVEEANNRFKSIKVNEQVRLIRNNMRIYMFLKHIYQCSFIEFEKQAY